jgi:hypothetical protein
MEPCEVCKELSCVFQHSFDLIVQAGNVGRIIVGFNPSSVHAVPIDSKLDAKWIGAVSVLGPAPFMTVLS